MLRAEIVIKDHWDLQISPIGGRSDEEVLQLLKDKKVELTTPTAPYSGHHAWQVLRHIETKEQVAFVDREPSNKNPINGKIKNPTKIG